MNLKFVARIQKKGLIESIYIGLSWCLNYFLSKIKIFLLRLRGYDIAYSVWLARDCRFFQSTKYAIKIERQCKIAHCVSITAGFQGSIVIKSNACLNPFTVIDIQNHLEIGEDTLVAPGCYICDYDHNFQDLEKPINKQGYVSRPIVIGSNVWIGAKSIILKGVQIGDGAIIGAGSVVISDIPPFSVAVGNPAKVIKKRIKK